MEQISKVSRLFRYFFIFLLVLFPLVEVSYWLTDGKILGILNPEVIDLHFIPKNLPSVDMLKPHVKFLAFLINLIPLSVKMVVLLFLIRLFGLYEKLEIFSLENVQAIKRMGYALIVGQALNPFYEALITLTCSFYNKPGERFISVSLNQTHLGIVALGFLLILISWIMNEGRKLKEEQAQVI